MAEDKKQPEKKQDKKSFDKDKKSFDKDKKEEKKIPAKYAQLGSDEILVRIAGYDIPGSKKVLPGLTRIKGVGWSISNAACIKLAIPKNKKISELTKPEIETIEKFLKNPMINEFLMNRRKDEETGESKHYIGTELEIKKDFDIRKMKKIRSYKGVRHTSGQPVRGQRTRSHFRKRGQAVSVMKKKEAPKK